MPVPEQVDHSGHLEIKGHILSRDPERPANFYRYRWPTQLSERTRFNVSLGWAKSEGLPPTGVTLDSSAPAPATLVELSGQIGSADVVYSGPALNGSVVTVHHVQARTGDTYYALVIANLARRAPEVAKGSSLPQGAVLGEIGPPGNPEPGTFSLWLACYRLAPGYSKAAWEVFPDNLLDSAALIPTDLRDVLPFF